MSAWNVNTNLRIVNRYEIVCTICNQIILSPIQTICESVTTNTYKLQTIHQIIQRSERGVKKNKQQTKNKERGVVDWECCRGEGRREAARLVCGWHHLSTKKQTHTDIDSVIQLTFWYSFFICLLFWKLLNFVCVLSCVRVCVFVKRQFSFPQCKNLSSTRPLFPNEQLFLFSISETIWIFTHFWLIYNLLRILFCLSVYLLRQRRERGDDNQILFCGVLWKRRSCSSQCRISRKIGRQLRRQNNHSRIDGVRRRITSSISHIHTSWCDTTLSII